MVRRPAWPAMLQLLKPVTWFPPMWAFLCGIVSSGAVPEGQWPLIMSGVLLAGPLICGTSQAVNDWFDRHVDAINEPRRPIPSGRLPGRWGLYIATVWTGVSLAVAAMLGTWVFAASLLGMALAWAYSAPPFRLKRNGWWGNSAVAICYEGVPWLTAAAVMTGTLPRPEIFALAILYSFGAHGIMTLNDFKSVQGDRRMGVGSLPVRLGVDGAARVACLVMVLAQIAVISLLILWALPIHAGIIAILLIGQLLMMAQLLQRPTELDVWYNALGVPLYVFGMMVSALAMRGLP
ncbi:MAG: chlorophyll synthase ChlG [Gammaproteobacteria bacterium]|nr:chlorophyll synthase ChlG [Gammaproteobacteria bacterium]